jgi:peroxiredoxin
VQLIRYYREIEEQNVRLFAVSVDPPEASEALRQQLEAGFTFLSDADGELLDRLGIRHRGGHGNQDIAYPTQILVDKEGIVRWTYEPDNYRLRASPEEIFAAMAALPG